MGDAGGAWAGSRDGAGAGAGALRLTVLGGGAAARPRRGIFPFFSSLLRLLIELRNDEK